MCYRYLYNDSNAKKDIKDIRENLLDNKDYKKINYIIDKQNEKLKQNSKNLNIDRTFSFLKINKIYLGFKSAPKIYAQYKKYFKEKGFKKKYASHPSLFFDFVEACRYYLDYLPD